MTIICHYVERNQVANRQAKKDMSEIIKSNKKDGSADDPLGHWTNETWTWSVWIGYR